MSPAEAPREIPDGERWLGMLGYDHLKGQPTGYEIDGQPVLAENFIDLCHDRAAPVLAALETMDPNNPQYEKYMGAARKMFAGYFGAIGEGS